MSAAISVGIPVGSVAKPSPFSKDDTASQQLQAQISDTRIRAGAPPDSADAADADERLLQLAKEVQDGVDDVSGAAEDKSKGAAPAKPAPKPAIDPVKDTTAQKPDVSELLSKPIAGDVGKPAKGQESETKAKPEDLFVDIQLPPQAKQKSAEAFAEVKARANAKIAELTKKVEELTAEVEKAKQQEVPESIRKELEELREFRARMDVQAHPDVKALSASGDQITEQFYAALKKGGISDEYIEKIKELGGPLQVDLTPVFEAIKDPVLRKTAEHRAMRLQEIEDEKAAKLKEISEHAREFLEEQSRRFEEEKHNFVRKSTEHFSQLAQNAAWLKPEALEALGVSSADAKGLVDEAFSALQSANDPNVRALLALVYVRNGIAERALANSRSEVDKLKSELEQAKASLAGVRNASSRLTTMSAPVVERQFSVVGLPTEAALDQLANHVLENERRESE